MLSYKSGQRCLGRRIGEKRKKKPQSLYMTIIYILRRKTEDDVHDVFMNSGTLYYTARVAYGLYSTKTEIS